MLRTIELVEGERRWLPATSLTQNEAAALQTHFGSQLDVQWQPGTPGGWWLGGRGWVGTLRCGAVQVVLHPRTPIATLTQLIVLAYDLPQTVAHDLHAAPTIDQLADRLADRLADGVLLRLRRGLYRAYRPHDDRLPYLRGRLRARDVTPTAATLPVTYKTLTADVPHNQIIACTLHALLRSAVLTPATAERVRRAARDLTARLDTARAALPAADWWQSLRYDRLNDDYRPLHALCRLLLDGLGVAEGAGTEPALPFLLDMARLFERGVAAWLRRHLPPAWRLLVQEHSIVAEGRVRIIADLVIVERAGGRVHSVLDTKYKFGPRPANEDVYQVVFYANARRSPRAVLIYPAPPAEPLAGRIDAVQLHTLPFDLALDLDAAGHALLGQLLDSTAHPVRSLDESPDHWLATQ